MPQRHSPRWIYIFNIYTVSQQIIQRGRDTKFHSTSRRQSFSKEFFVFLCALVAKKNKRSIHTYRC